MNERVTRQCLQTSLVEIGRLVYVCGVLCGRGLKVQVGVTSKSCKRCDQVREQSEASMRKQ